MSAYWDNVLFIMGRKKISQVDLASAINKTKGTVNTWIKRDTLPPADYAHKIASFLNVTVEYLVTGRNPEPDECVIKMKNSPATRRIVKALLKLPEKDVEKVWLGLVGILSALGYGKEEEKGDADSMVG